MLKIVFLFRGFVTTVLHLRTGLEEEGDGRKINLSVPTQGS